jgi:hypothetical protein
MSVLVPQVVFVQNLAFVRLETRGAIFGFLNTQRFVPYKGFSDGPFNPTLPDVWGYIVPFPKDTRPFYCKIPNQKAAVDIFGCAKAPSGQTAGATLEVLVKSWNYVCLIPAQTPPGRSTELLFTRDPALIERLCNPRKSTSGWAVFDGPADIILKAQALGNPPANVPAPATPSCAPGQIGIPPVCLGIPAPVFSSPPSGPGVPALPAGTTSCPPGTYGIAPYCVGMPSGGAAAPSFIPSMPSIPGMPAGLPAMPGVPSGLPALPSVPSIPVPGFSGFGESPVAFVSDAGPSEYGEQTPSMAPPATGGKVDDSSVVPYVLAGVAALGVAYVLMSKKD